MIQIMRYQKYNGTLLRIDGHCMSCVLKTECINNILSIGCFYRGRGAKRHCGGGPVRRTVIVLCNINWLA